MYNQIYGPASALCPICGKLIKDCMGFCITDNLTIIEKVKTSDPKQHFRKFNIKNK